MDEAWVATLLLPLIWAGPGYSLSELSFLNL